MSTSGYLGLVRGALPSFTNVNNACIATGRPPSVTGISGNFFLDPDTGKEVMMNDASYLRCGTILAAAARAGRHVAIVTAKEKLRDMLSHDLDGIAFSSEKANEARLETHGIEAVEALTGEPTPGIYSADASLFVLKAGVTLIQQARADFLYLSLTDYIQHKYKSVDPVALDFYTAIDREIGRLLNTGAVVSATADHGMNDKNGADGKPNVIYLEQLLRKRFGDGITVICPITDPYVVHHGALGSLVMMHLADPSWCEAVAKAVLDLDGITEVYDRTQAARKLELPEDRIGDLTVLAGRDVVFGRMPAYHDLSVLDGGLRSHGGRYEEMVPMLLSEPLNEVYAARVQRDPRNFDIFEFTCNAGTG